MVDAMVIEFIAGIILIIALIIRVLQQKKLIDLLADAKYQQRLFKNFTKVRFYLKLFMLFIACCGITIAIMRPRSQQTRQQACQGRDIMIVMDISKSMLATDCKPDRLTFAREKIKYLIERLSADRVGLIIFAGSACTLCPFTADYQTFLLFLDSLDKDVMSNSSTSFVAALQMVKQRFQNQEFATEKNVLLVTDGEDFSEGADSIYQELADMNVRIATLSVGTLEGSPIPDDSQPGNYIKDGHGNIVISKRSDERLAALAQACRGCYAACDVTGDQDIQAIYSWLTSSKGQREINQIVYQEYYSYPATIALIALIVELLL